MPPSCTGACSDGGRTRWTPDDGNRRVGHRVARPYTLTAPVLRTGREAVQVRPEALCLQRVMRAGANAGCR
jgi:hypothetical protein